MLTFSNYCLLLEAIPKPEFEFGVQPLYKKYNDWARIFGDEWNALTPQQQGGHRRYQSQQENDLRRSPTKYHVTRWTNLASILKKDLNPKYKKLWSISAPGYAYVSAAPSKTMVREVGKGKNWPVVAIEYHNLPKSITHGLKDDIWASHGEPYMTRASIPSIYITRIGVYTWGWANAPKVFNDPQEALRFCKQVVAKRGGK